MPHTILIVDDNPLIRVALRASLEDKGEWHVCGEAENGKEAIDRVGQLHPDIVILDLQMPVMNGLEAGKEIARIAPDTPLLMFTMHRSPELIRLANAAGICHVISKSEGTAILITAIENIIAAHPPPSQPGRPAC
ncbi:MAG: response regulator transcription factor [Candidatus Sulfotelmatobacter sp.]